MKQFKHVVTKKHEIDNRDEPKLVELYGIFAPSGF